MPRAPPAPTPGSASPARPPPFTNGYPLRGDTPSGHRGVARHSVSGPTVPPPRRGAGHRARSPLLLAPRPPSLPRRRHGHDALLGHRPPRLPAPLPLERVEGPESRLLAACESRDRSGAAKGAGRRARGAGGAGPENTICAPPPAP